MGTFWGNAGRAEKELAFGEKSEVDVELLEECTEAVL